MLVVDLGVWFRVGCPGCVHEYEAEQEQKRQFMGCVWCAASFVVRRPNVAGASERCVQSLSHELAVTAALMNTT